MFLPLTHDPAQTKGILMCSSLLGNLIGLIGVSIKHQYARHFEVYVLPCWVVFYCYYYISLFVIANAHYL